MAESIIEPVIEIEHLTLGYKNCRIINDINAQINAGEIIGIIGPNGAGKSTFLKTLRNLMPCLTGKVKFFGKDNTELSAKDFARIVAYLQQNTLGCNDIVCPDIAGNAGIRQGEGRDIYQ